MTATAFVGHKTSVAGIARRMLANAAGFVRLLARTPRSASRQFSNRFAVVLVCTIGIAVAAMFLLDRWEMPLHRQMPYAVLGIASFITDFGKSNWFLVPSGALLILIAAVASPRLGRTSYLVLTSVAVRLAFVFTAVALPSLAVTIAKRMIGRARPASLDWNAPFQYLPFSWRVDHASLPSGHATTAFAAATAIGALFPQARPWMWAYATLIALTRVVLAAHYPSDVITGAAVGVVGVLLVRRWFAARRLAFAVQSDGATRAIAGRSWHRLSAAFHRVFAR